MHRSNDVNGVNGVSGFTIHEHNSFTARLDFVRNTVTLSGAINIAQRRAMGSVIDTTGHKVLDLMTGEPIFIAGPDKPDDSDFCAAVAP